MLRDDGHALSGTTADEKPAIPPPDLAILVLRLVVADAGLGA